ncbi:hypothetical protein [Faecalibacterium sp. An192]|uniref:hypothetical protein n=1 Tax=Faecalibacterium sp. An192 TaxID=1965581 RepID=UPI001182FDE4|nr:hypothetical protein [Faecalibacterium sp. An192]
MDTSRFAVEGAEEISPVLPSDSIIYGGERAKSRFIPSGRKTAKTKSKLHLKIKNPRPKWSEDFVFDRFWGHTGAEHR